MLTFHLSCVTYEMSGFYIFFSSWAFISTETKSLYSSSLSEYLQYLQQVLLNTASLFFFFFKDSLFCGSPKAQRCSLLVFQRSTIWFSGSAGKVGVFEGSETKSLSPAFIPAAVVPLSCLFEPCSCSVFSFIFSILSHDFVTWGSSIWSIRCFLETCLWWRNAARNIRLH